jgi:hypothetical protein
MTEMMQLLLGLSLPTGFLSRISMVRHPVGVQQGRPTPTPAEVEASLDAQSQYLDDREKGAIQRPAPLVLGVL